MGASLQVMKFVEILLTQQWKTGMRPKIQQDAGISLPPTVITPSEDSVPKTYPVQFALHRQGPTPTELTKSVQVGVSTRDGGPPANYRSVPLCPTAARRFRAWSSGSKHSNA